MQENNYQIKKLEKNFDKENFNSGIESLDRYLNQQASQDMRRNLNITYVLTKIDNNTIIGYYTLSSTSVNFNNLPNELIKRLPRYPTLPATLIGRLAVNKTHQSQGLGELLLIDALIRSFTASKKIGSIAVVVDAIDDNAAQFYQKYGFNQFNDIKNKLFLPIATIEKSQQLNKTKLVAVDN